MRHAVSIKLLTVLGILLVAGSLFVIIASALNRHMPTRTTLPAEHANSHFTFASTQGWRQGATNQTSLAVFNQNSCFASAEYRPGISDIAAELQHEQSLHTSAGRTVTTLPVKRMSLQTNTTPVAYDLHQFAIDTPASALPVKPAQATGYARVNGGVIKLMGYCDKTEQLDTVATALARYRYTP